MNSLAIRLGVAIAMTMAGAVGAQPLISAITPSRGSINGGEVVEITGQLFKVSCPQSCDLESGVFFGGVRAEVIKLTATSATVNPPKHAPGTVDVTILNGTTGRAVARDAYTYVTSGGDPEYERILIPTYISGPGGLPGAFGSVFKTFLFGRQPVSPAPPRVTQSPDPTCRYPECQADLPTSFFFSPVLTTNQDLAAFLYIQKFKPQDIPLYDTAKRGLGEPDVALHLRVQDISRQSQTWGTEVPIVRESEARTEVHLVDIPTSSAFRKKIRVFDFSGLNGLQMQATITDMATGSILAKKDLTLSGATFNGAGYPLTPASSQFDLTSTDFTRLPETERVSVTILPKTFALVRYWGYATIVNNETQHITLITPQ